MGGIELEGFVWCEVEEGEGGMRGRHSLNPLATKGITSGLLKVILSRGQNLA